MRKVAVVGYGGIFPNCRNIEDFEKGLFLNKSFVREFPDSVNCGKQTASKVSAFVSPEHTGIEEKKYEYLKDYPETYIDTLGRIPEANLETADIGSIWAMLSSIDACKMAGWSKSELESEATGVAIGSGGSPPSILRPMYNNFFLEKRKTRHLTAHNVDRSMAFRESANVSCLIKNKGVSESLASACATGLSNIGYGYRLIKDGYQDRVLVGGTEDVSIGMFAQFDSMRVLSKGYDPEKSSRPFDKKRNGFVASSGCAVIALEEYEAAKARGANIIAVIDGYHNNCDGDGDMFNPSYDGRIRLYEGLKRDVELSGGIWRVPDVVNVHGTSTVAGDLVELISTTDYFGTDGYLISAPKSQFGHMLGAAGAVEFLVSILMIKNQKVSPCLNSDELSNDLEASQKKESWEGSKIPASEFRHLIPQKAVEKKIENIVSTNYGFGGTNGIISISKGE